MTGTLLLSGPHWQCPALLTRVLSIELQPLEVVSNCVLSCAPILVGVSCVPALFHAVPEEPAGAEAGEAWARGGSDLTAPWHWAWPGTVCQQQEGAGAHCLWQGPGAAHLFQWGSLLSTVGFPTTINRALALVMATLSL